LRDPAVLRLFNGLSKAQRKALPRLTARIEQIELGEIVGGESSFAQAPRPSKKDASTQTAEHPSRRL